MCREDRPKFRASKRPSFNALNSGNTLVLCPKDHVKLFTQIPNEEP